ncbi:unnamed protein product [Chrysodeixis includens]|uniref:Uncharacterized protein n=1 Tax=Chrysodeixis includens TaxID=689277 RepID=A0A9N8KUX9_CHRIL|nr:unnamed protein product [Chrysodeixis includens]
MNKKKPGEHFFNTVTPIKLTEARRVKLHSEGWGILTDYYLDSVKVTNAKGRITSAATLRISDRSGQVTCVVRGQTVGLLFGLNLEEWQVVENMCNRGDQLFYRYFKNGVNRNFSIEHKVFYNLCMTSQTNDPLIARYRRSVNTRNKYKSDAFLDILELRHCDNNLLDLYVDQVSNSTLKQIRIME